MCEVIRGGVLYVLNSEQQQAGWSRSPAKRELPDAWGFWFVLHSNVNAHVCAYPPLMASAPISDRGGLQDQKMQLVAGSSQVQIQIRRVIVLCAL